MDTNHRRGVTLLEMLAYLTIMAMMLGFFVVMSGVVTHKMDDAETGTEINNIVSFEHQRYAPLMSYSGMYNDTQNYSNRFTGFPAQYWDSANHMIVDAYDNIVQVHSDTFNNASVFYIKLNHLAPHTCSYLASIDYGSGMVRESINGSLFSRTSAQPIPNTDSVTSWCNVKDGTMSIWFR